MHTQAAPKNELGQMINNANGVRDCCIQRAPRTLLKYCQTYVLDILEDDCKIIIIAKITVSNLWVINIWRVAVQVKP
jgi:hypothetical protein